MDLVQVNVVCAEAGQGRIDLFHDGLARQAGPAGAAVHLEVHLRGEYDVFAAGVFHLVLNSCAEAEFPPTVQFGPFCLGNSTKRVERVLSEDQQ